MLGVGNDTNYGSLQPISSFIRMTGGCIRYGLKRYKK
jgi:hypothetical protein